MNPTVADETVNHYGPILIRRGYEWVELEDVAHASALDLTQITKSFPNKALLCNAWMEKTDARTKKHHTLLLKSGQPPRDILKIYFDELKKFMEDGQKSTKMKSAIFSNNCAKARAINLIQLPNHSSSSTQVPPLNQQTSKA